MAVALVLLVMVVGGRDGRLGAGEVLVLLGVTAAAAAVLWRMLRAWGLALLAECRRGYATTTFEMGRFWFRAAPGAPWTLGLVGWDFSGVWVLGSDGRLRPPVRTDVHAPGIYPSPRGDGRWELWTGSQWSGWVLGAD